MESENDLKVTEELIAKYLSGEANPEEAVALHDWLQVPENKARFEELESMWNAANPSRKVRAVNMTEAWRKIEPKTSASGTKERSLITARTIGIAASVVLAVAEVLWYFGPGASADSVTMTSDSTQNVTLADDSRITLYRNSSLEFPEAFKDEKREVKLLKGEAFFSVTKNEEQPFIVHAGFADVRVIGTEFNVIVRNDEVIVGVNEGRVLFYTANDSIYIEKGTAASIKQTDKATAIDVDANTWAYATRKLVFKDTPMNEVIGAIEKAYGRTIRASNDNVKNCKLTATFNNEPVEKIVFLIAESLNLKLEKNGQVFILEGDSCP